MDILRTLVAKDPVLEWPVKFCLGVTTVTYLLTLVTGNVSQVDRVWTLLPTIYVAYYALLPLWPRMACSYFHPYTPSTVQESLISSFSLRALLMLALVVTWMCRRVSIFFCVCVRAL
ncbi:hypothetical protein ID866_3410 [Astraeus odoratus]|nr:hypothetical protein ID866_3410 [Astraeus odoratus]